MLGPSVEEANAGVEVLIERWLACCLRRDCQRPRWRRSRRFDAIRTRERGRGGIYEHIRGVIVLSYARARC